MKLICEEVEDVNYIVEEVEGKKKNYFIEGIFMQANIPNRNKRLYPLEILEKEVNRYNNDAVLKNKAYGELGHPSGPGINLDRVSHIITELRKDGNNFIGKAKITSTPMGDIAKGIMESGGVLGVSTRGLGTLIKNSQGINEVQTDFFLASGADIVADPSAPDAFVRGIMESVNYFWDNGFLKAEQVSEQAVVEIEKAIKSRVLTEEKKLEILEKYLRSIV